MLLKGCSIFWFCIRLLSCKLWIIVDSSCVLIQWHSLCDSPAGTYKKCCLIALLTTMWRCCLQPQWQNSGISFLRYAFYQLKDLNVLHTLNCYTIVFGLIYSHNPHHVYVNDQVTCNYWICFAFSAVPWRDCSSCVLYILHCISYVLQAVWRWVQREPHSNNSWMDCW